MKPKNNSNFKLKNFSASARFNLFY